jgi:Flp pilus assembly protein CpaB
VAIQANKPNSRIFLLLGVVLAAAAAIAVLLLVRSNAPANEVNVVVSDASIPAGTTLTPAMVIVAQVPASARPGDAYSDPVAVVGKVTQVALANNTPLVPGFFSTPSLAITSSGTGSAAVSVESLITKGYVAVAIPTTASLPPGFTQAQQNGFTSPLVADAGYILPGDHIDILIANTSGGTSGDISWSFQDVIVLRVGSPGDSATSVPQVLLVEVPRSQAALLSALMIGDGGHQLVVKYVLRPQFEWGKLDVNGYKPNYESSGSPNLPVVSQSVVTPGMLDSLFGR